MKRNAIKTREQSTRFRRLWGKQSCWYRLALSREKFVVWILIRPPDGKSRKTNFVPANLYIIYICSISPKFSTNDFDENLFKKRNNVLLDFEEEFVANGKFFKNIANNVWEEKSKIHSSMLESGAKNLWKRSRESFAWRRNKSSSSGRRESADGCRTITESARKRGKKEGLLFEKWRWRDPNRRRYSPQKN